MGGQEDTTDTEWKQDDDDDDDDTALRFSR